MIQLGAELRRFAARRIVRGMLIVAAIIVVVAVVSVTARGHEPRRESAFPGSGFTNLQPGEQPPSFSFISSDTRIDVGARLDNVLVGTGIAMTIVAFVLGASFVGAEFNGASLTTQLLFEPRRWRVHVSKAAAVAIGVAVVSLLISALVAVSMLVGSELHGIVRDVDGAFWMRRAAQSLRIAAAVGFGGVMAYTVTLVTRRTSAGVIAFLLQFPLIGLSATSGPFHLLSRCAPLRALLVMVSDPRNAADAVIHTLAGAVVLTIVWLAALTVVAGGIFSRAEVR